MNKQIASDLGTTERTIKAHRQRVMWKLNATSITELVSTAERLGISIEQKIRPGRTPQPAENRRRLPERKVLPNRRPDQPRIALSTI